MSSDLLIVWRFIECLCWGLQTEWSFLSFVSVEVRFWVFLDLGTVQTDVCLSPAPHRGHHHHEGHQRGGGGAGRARLGSRPQNWRGRAGTRAARAFRVHGRVEEFQRCAHAVLTLDFFSNSYNSSFCLRLSLRQQLKWNPSTSAQRFPSMFIRLIPLHSFYMFLFPVLTLHLSGGECFTFSELYNFLCLQ